MNFNLYLLQGLYPISMQASGSGASRRFAAVWAETDLPKSRSFSKSGLNIVGMTMFDTCHADNVAVHAQRHPGEPETLPGGIRDLAEKLAGKIGRVHLIDSDGTINEHKTSTHPPFGEGNLDFDGFMPAIAAAGCPDDWWTIDLCFWPDAWSATAKCKAALDQLVEKYG